MTSATILALYNKFKEIGITVWINGGWGVDALLCRQTREHSDLDVADQRKDNAKLRQLLENSGYKDEKRFDSSEFMYVMKNEVIGCVDIHVFEYDESGKTVINRPPSRYRRTIPPCVFIGGLGIKCRANGLTTRDTKTT